MGQELDCQLRYKRRTVDGRAYLETDYLLFRGSERLKVPFKDLTGVKASGTTLQLEFPGGPAVLELGAAAEKWAHKILHPPSRLDKLGVKAGMNVSLVGEFDADFVRELRAQNVRSEGGPADVILFAAGKKAHLARISKLARGLKPAGGLWVVYPKGVAAIREMDVLEAGRAAGLKDNKVANFSASHTALRFVIPLAAR